MIAETFFKYFDVLIADTETTQEAFRIRYQVYCEELGYEDPARFPDGLERDEFDSFSTQLLLRHRSTGSYVGTVRLVIPPAGSDLETPLERFCRHAADPAILDLQQLSKGSYCEISRLAVHRHFRRRKNEANKPFVYDGVRAEISAHEQANFPYISVGLYVAAAACLRLNRLEYAIVMMEPRLARLLTRQGAYYQAFGAAMEYHGTRAPYYITPRIIGEGIQGEIRQLLRIMEGRLSHQLCAPPPPTRSSPDDKRSNRVF